MDRFLPGYFHGYRPALQVDAIAFGALLQDRSPALYSHLRSLDFALDRLVERWFLSLFTASLVPLPTVMRIWDAFFVQGVRIFYGIGLALLFRAEETLFHAKTAIEAEEYLRVTERSSIDADVLFAHVFKEDLNISWLTDEQLERWRTTYRQRLVASVSNKVEILSDKIGHLSGLRELCARCSVSAKYLLETSLAEPVLHKRSSVGSMLSDTNDDDNFASGSVRADLAQSVKEVESHLKKLVDVITSLSSKYATKRSKWQAISSQLTACPLARLPNPDSYSWLTQVREGKISGAGYDSSYSPEEWEGFVSAERLMEVSDMVFDTGDATLVNADASGNGAASCLTSYRKDLQLTELHLSEVLIYALISAVKALSALRLELQAASFRAQLLCGHWIDAPIDFPMPERRKSPSVAGAAPFPGGPNSRQSTRVTKAPAGVIANIGSGNVRRPRPMDDSALFERRSESSREARPFRRATSRSLYQSRLRPSISLGAGSIASPVLEEDPGLLLEEELLMSPTTSFGDDPDEDEGVIDPKVLAQIAQDGATGLTGWFVESAESMYAQEFSSCAEDPYLNEGALRRYQQGGKALADLHTRFVGSFSRFIRLESRARNWDVRERAVILEQDLQRELREVESEVAALQWQ